MSRENPELDARVRSVSRDVMGQENVILAEFLSDYLESSSSLAESAIQGVLDYCRHFGITTLTVSDADYDAESPEWWAAQRFWKEEGR